MHAHMSAGILYDGMVYTVYHLQYQPLMINDRNPDTPSGIQDSGIVTQ